MTAYRQTEFELRASEERYRRITQTITDYIYTVRIEDGRAVETRHGPGCLAITGYTCEEFETDPYLWLRMVAPEDREAVLAQTRQLLAGQPVEALEHRLIRKDGAIRWIRNTPVPHRDSHGQLVGYDGLIHDITERRLAEMALRESEARYRTLIEQASDGIFLTDTSGRFLEANPTGCEMLGYTRAELLNCCLADIIHPDDLLQRPLQLDNLRNGTTLRQERLLRRKDGRALPTEISARIIGGGRLQAIVRDISDRKQAEAEQRRLAQERDRLLTRFQLVLERMPLGCIISDHDGYISYWNPAAEQIFGFSAAEAKGRRLAEILYPSAPQAWEENLRQRLADKSSDIIREVTANLTREGQRITCEWLMTVLGDSGEGNGGWLSMVQDITARLHAEAQIRQLNAELEQRVRDRTLQLEATNKELEAFSYSVSHDLRAPLRAIDGYARILQECYRATMTDEMHDYLRRISEATHSMGRLIDDLLKLSRLTTGDIYRRPVNLSALANAIATQLHQSQPERNVSFVIAADLHAEGDERLLHIALENLLGNAWKFTAKIPTAQIEFGCLSGSVPDAPVYYVRDNGAGFDMQYASKLFGPFQRLHPATEFPGTGVGLAIVQRIIRRHGGQVWAESTPGQGATFYFTLA